MNGQIYSTTIRPVSYTHLDVYKRQVMFRAEHPLVIRGRLGTGGFGPPKLNQTDIAVLVTIAAIAPCIVKFIVYI